MQILIVDDELLACERLRSLIEELQVGTVVGIAHNGKQALLEIFKLEPDVILLDIRMPGMDGLETAQHISKLDTPPAVIFTTAYDDYALDAFAAHAIDYLLKPIRKQRLLESLTAAKRLTRVQINELKQKQNKTTPRTHLSARIHGDVKLIPINEILYLLADQKYVTVGTTDSEDLIDDSLISLEVEFGELFFRIHRNALVATKNIEALERTNTGQMLIKCRNSERRLDVSRRHLPGLRKLIK